MKKLIWFSARFDVDGETVVSNTKDVKDGEKELSFFKVNEDGEKTLFYKFIGSPKRCSEELVKWINGTT